MLAQAGGHKKAQQISLLSGFRIKRFFIVVTALTPDDYTRLSLGEG
jgi:hypothetical protein